MSKLRITNIQRMCFHDGPGIRTTVFLKGCSIHCPWCSNPENIRFEKEEYLADGKKGVYGKDYYPEELVNEVMKDKEYWGVSGGVTFSGGEALMQTDALLETLMLLKEQGVHTAVETALFVPEVKVARLVPWIDYIIADAKIMNAEICKKILGGDIKLYLRNVESAYKSGSLKLFRVPLCPEYTYTDENRWKLISLFKLYPEIPVQIFRVHNLGEKKYESLKRILWTSSGLNEAEMETFLDQLKENHINAEIIRI